ncbi:hypothetical protein CCP3SC15_1540010 [Gammaproteobacteria bacterium]
MTDDAHVDALRVMVDELRSRNEALIAAMIVIDAGYMMLNSDEPVVVDRGKGLIACALKKYYEHD